MKASPLDLDYVNEIKSMQVDGAPDFYAELCKLFVETMPVLAKQLIEAAANQNLGGVADAAHKLKSGSANVGAMHLSRLSQALESLGHSQQSSDGQLEQLANKFNEEFTAVMSELRQMVV